MKSSMQGPLEDFRREIVADSAAQAALDPEREYSHPIYDHERTSERRRHEGYQLRRRRYPGPFQPRQQALLRQDVFGIGESGEKGQHGTQTNNLQTSAHHLQGE